MTLLGVASDLGTSIYNCDEADPVPVWQSASSQHGEKAVTGFCWLSSGIFVTCGEDGKMQMRHAFENHKEAEFVLPPSLSTSSFTCMSNGPERRDIVTGVSDGSVLIWNTKQVKPTHRLQVFHDPINCVDVFGSPTLSQAKIAVASFSGRLMLVRECGVIYTSLPDLESRALLKFGIDGRLGCVSLSGRGVFVDATRCVELSSFRVTEDVTVFNRMNTSPHTFLSGSTCGNVSTIDLRSSKTSKLLSCHRGLSSLTISCEDRLTACSTENVVEVFDQRNTQSPLHVIDYLGEDAVLSFVNQNATVSKENISSVTKTAKSVPAFRPPLRDLGTTSKDCAPVIHQTSSAPIDRVEVSTQTFAVTQKQDNHPQDKSQLNDKLDEQHIDLVARMATIEIEMQEMRRSIDKILFFLQRPGSTIRFDSHLLNGWSVADKILAEVRQDVLKLQEKRGLQPHLVIVSVGLSQQGAVYVGRKIHAAELVGIKVTHLSLESTTDEERILLLIAEFAKQPEVHGLMLQLPLPKMYQTQRVLSVIPAGKDVDGLGPAVIGSLAARQTVLAPPCTAQAVVELLRAYKIHLSGKLVVVIGRGRVAGLPIALTLLNEDATVVTAHSKTTDIETIIGRADIVVVAIGQRGFLRRAWLKSGCVVIDVGCNVNEDGTVVGDFEYLAHEDASIIRSPVPGGVGPLTVAMLMRNTLRLAQLSVN